MASESVPDVTGPTVVHKVKSKLGYTEMHTTAPGFHEDVRKEKNNVVPLWSTNLIL